MILVDSSIWIDQLCHRETPQTLAFERLLLAEQDIVVGDLVMMEVLQGTRDDRSFHAALAHLSGFRRIQISDGAIAIAAAQNYRTLRARGVTIRKTIDVLIATRCLMDDMPLLYRDRDFDPFVEHFGLRVGLEFASGVN